MSAITNLIVANFFFNKGINKLITFSSGGFKMHMDYIMTRHANLKQTENIKVVCGEECALQNRLPVRDFNLLIYASS